MIDLKNYTLLFEDEFDTLNLSSHSGNHTGWNTEYHYGDRFLSGEQQVYVDPEYQGLGLNPFSVEDGVLTITAEKAGPEIDLPDNFGYSLDNAYTSGLVTTEEMFSTQYGYFEVSAQMPGSKGMWPAAWLLQSDGEWPGEIDIIEVLGHETDKLYATQHYVEDGTHTKAGDVSTNFDSADGFHTYGIDWQQDTVTWYFDGQKVFEADNQIDDQAMYFLMNLAVGGWAGRANLEDGETAEMNIDYVRIYQQNVDHDVVGVPDEWVAIGDLTFSTLDMADFQTIDWQNDLTTWGYETAMEPGTTAGFMMNDWAHILKGNADENYLRGADGKYNHIEGMGGNDILEGGLGSDHFVIRDGDGNDTIVDFSNEAGNTDKLKLDGFHFTHFDDVMPYLTETEEGTYLRLNVDQAVFLQNVSIFDLSPEQFILTNSVEAPDNAPIWMSYDDPDLPLHDSVEKFVLDQTTLSFNADQFSGYGRQHQGGDLTLEEGGTEFTLSGNTWQKYEFDYDVTGQTVIEFEYKTDNGGEIAGIGFETNGVFTYANKLFAQIDGTQDYNFLGQSYSSDGQWQSFKFNVSDFQQQDISYLVFANDMDDRDTGATSSYRNIMIYEQQKAETPEIDLPDSHTFDESLFSYYEGQPATGTATVSGEGTEVTLHGNTWQKYEFDYDITDNTIIEFDYKTEKDGEIFGLGFETDGTFAYEDKVFAQIDGNDEYNSFNQWYSSGGDWQSFRFHISDFQQEAISYLVFANDMDHGNQDAVSSYRNIKIYENDEVSAYHEETLETTLYTDGDDEFYSVFAGTDRHDVFSFDNDLGGHHMKIRDFSSEDTLDISALLEQYDPVTDAISDFVALGDQDNVMEIQVDRDGAGQDYDFETVAQLKGSVPEADLEQWLGQENLII